MGVPFWHVPEWFCRNSCRSGASCGFITWYARACLTPRLKIHSDPGIMNTGFLVELLCTTINNKASGSIDEFYSTNGQVHSFYPKSVMKSSLVLNQDPRYPIILGSVYSQKTNLIVNLYRMLKTVGQNLKKNYAYCLTIRDQILQYCDAE